MAGNTRGKLKEEFEGIHRNLDWTIVHCQKALILIRDHKPNLADSVESLGEAVSTLDNLARGIYSKL